jgi:hypothetical protein
MLTTLPPFRLPGERNGVKVFAIDLTPLVQCPWLNALGLTESQHPTKKLSYPSHIALCQKTVVHSIEKKSFRDTKRN